MMSVAWPPAWLVEVRDVGREHAKPRRAVAVHVMVEVEKLVVEARGGCGPLAVRCMLAKAGYGICRRERRVAWASCVCDEAGGQGACKASVVRCVIQRVCQPAR